MGKWEWELETRRNLTPSIFIGSDFWRFLEPSFFFGGWVPIEGPKLLSFVLIITLSDSNVVIQKLGTWNFRFEAVDKKPAVNGEFRNEFRWWAYISSTKWLHDFLQSTRRNSPKQTFSIIFSPKKTVKQSTRGSSCAPVFPFPGYPWETAATGTSEEFDRWHEGREDKNRWIFNRIWWKTCFLYILEHRIFFWILGGGVPHFTKQ